MLALLAAIVAFNSAKSPYFLSVGNFVNLFELSIEKSIVAQPDPIERRRGIYDYLVEMPPATVKARPAREAASARATASARVTAPALESYTRSTPDQMGGRVIRRIPSR